MKDQQYWKEIDDLFYVDISEQTLIASEKALKDDPTSLECRIQIAAYHCKRLDCYNEQLEDIALWCMRNHPDASFLFHQFYPTFCHVDARALPAYFKAEAIWLDNMAHFPTSRNVNYNALMFTGLYPEKQSELRRRLLELQPEDLHAKEHYFEEEVISLINYPKYEQKLRAQELLEEYRIIEPLLRERRLKSKDDVIISLESAIDCAFIGEAFDDAKVYCEEILCAKKWPYQSDSTSIVHQHALNILGLIASREGNVKLACEYLKRAGKIKYPRDTIPWMYPDTELAAELLLLGKKSEVIDFLFQYPNCHTGDNQTFQQAIHTLKSCGEIKFINRTSTRYPHDGLKLFKYGKRDRAMKMMQISNKLEIGDPRQVYYLACLQSLFGETSNAATTLAKAFSMDPTLKKSATDDSRLDGVYSPAIQILENSLGVV